MRKVLIMVAATGCLLVVLMCGGGAWSIHRGLLAAPTAFAQIGDLEVLSFTELNFSPGRPTRAYYTLWVAFHSRSAGRARVAGPLEWAHRLVRIEVPAPMVAAQ
jgi:hypothetical protein